MPDNKHIIQEGLLLLHWGPLDPDCFARANTWCEYYEPKELAHMVAWGVSTIWIEEHIIEPLEHTNASAWYATAVDIEVPPCEIMATYTIFEFQNIERSGYLTISMGEITSGTVFMEGQPNLILSLADDFSEDNREDLERLAKSHGLSWRQLLPIRYQTRGKNPFGISVGTLDIPTSSATPDRD